MTADRSSHVWRLIARETGPRVNITALAGGDPARRHHFYRLLRGNAGCPIDNGREPNYEHMQELADALHVSFARVKIAVDNDLAEVRHKLPPTGALNDQAQAILDYVRDLDPRQRNDTAAALIKLAGFMRTEQEQTG